MRADLLVDDVMRIWPATVRVFMERKMYCVGCPVTVFHTVEEACHAHGIEADSFLAALEAAIMEPVTVVERSR